MEILPSTYLVLCVNMGPTLDEVLQAVTVPHAHRHVQGGTPDLQRGRKGGLVPQKNLLPCAHLVTPLTLSRALIWAPWFSSSLTMFRCPPRHAQKMGVLSSCKNKAAKRWHDRP